MKLRNKKTGEIIETDFGLSISIPDDEKLYGCDTYTQLKGYTSIAELNEEWEDVAEEEPEKYYVINPVDWKDIIGEIEYRNDSTDKINKEIGNYFETKEEAEKAVEKLKAWQRLKDKGFRLNSWNWKTQCIDYNLDYTDITEEQIEEAEKDLDLLFSQEDD